MARDLNMTGGSPWGFTLSGGKEFRSPLKVSKITPGGKAAKGGMRFGDYIIEINGESTEGLNHSDAMMLIKTTGMDLRLTLSKEPPKSPQGDSKFDHDTTDSAASERPRPPAPPTNTAPPKQAVSVSSATIRSSSNTKPKSPTPKAQPSAIVPGSGLDTGSSSTVQSPAFRKIHIDNTPTPRVTSQPRPSPPTQGISNIVIDDGNVRKTSQRPQPPSSAPSKVSTTTVKVAKGSPIAKPAPPQTAASQQPTSPSGTTKVVDRQGVCASCSEPIRGPFASAMGRVWHPEHFTCSSCNKSLQNTTFVYEEEKIICEECYSNAFAQTCHSCHQQILGQCVSAVGLHWHQEHFTCSRCTADLSKGDGFNMENNLLFCADCYSSLYGASCSGCGEKIGGGELWVEALDGTWHSSCFICESCKNPLEGATFFAKLGRPYCKSCA